MPYFFFPLALLLGAGAELVLATLDAREDEPEAPLLLLLTLSSALFYENVSKLVVTGNAQHHIP